MLSFAHFLATEGAQFLAGIENLDELQHMMMWACSCYSTKMQLRVTPYY